MLCERCQTLQTSRDLARATTSPRVPKDVETLTLRAAALAGCGLCAVIYNGFKWYSCLDNRDFPNAIQCYPPADVDEPFFAWEDPRGTAEVLEFYASDGKLHYPEISVVMNELIK
jgi:hypothetical protein